MKKFSLAIDDLKVESFSTLSEAGRRGTVIGLNDTSGFEIICNQSCGNTCGSCNHSCQAGSCDVSCDGTCDSCGGASCNGTCDSCYDTCGFSCESCQWGCNGEETIPPQIVCR